jgi:hypothetical protein
MRWVDEDNDPDRHHNLTDILIEVHCSVILRLSNMLIFPREIRFESLIPPQHRLIIRIAGRGTFLKSQLNQIDANVTDTSSNVSMAHDHRKDCILSALGTSESGPAA